MSITPSWLDQHLEGLASRHELERAPDLVEPHRVCDESVRREGARLQRLHRPADRSRRVLKGAEERQLLVVRPPGVQANRSPGRAPNKDYNGGAEPRGVD